MAADTESIAALQQCLVLYRRTVEFLEIQRAQFGAFTPAYIWHQFDSTRSEIARVKQDLRQLGVPVEDHPSDAGVTPTGGAQGDQHALLMTYQRMLLSQVSEVPPVGLSSYQLSPVALDTVYVERALLSYGAALPDPTQDTVISPPPILADVLRGYGARVVLEGPLGSGKSIELRRLAWAACIRALEECPPPRDPFQHWNDVLPLPILLSGHEIASALFHANAAPDDHRQPTLQTFWSAIETWLHYSDFTPLVPTFQRMLEQGRCLIMIDGFDDLPEGADQRAFALALARFTARYPANRFVITCRSYDPIALAPLAAFARFEFAPLEEKRAGQIAANWYMALAWRNDAPIQAEDRASLAQLDGILAGDARLRSLASIPLILALCAASHADGQMLTRGREAVLHRLCDLLLHDWDEYRVGGYAHSSVPEFDQLSIDQRMSVFEPLARALLSKSPIDSPAALRRFEVESLLLEGFSQSEYQHQRITSQSLTRLVDWACRHGLLVAVSSGVYSIPQRQVCEYLAARALSSRADFLTVAHSLRYDSQWREPLLLAVHELGRRGLPHVAREFIAQLLNSVEGGGGSSELILAAESLLELDERSYAERSLRGDLQEQLMRLMERPGASVCDRVQAGMLLGLLSDNKTAGPLPKLIHIPEGTCIIGSDDGYDDEGPQQRMHIPTFTIGTYPVTNREYAVFLAEQSEGRAVPHYWYDQRLNNPSAPVVGVTWDDANDYCMWLTEVLQRSRLIPPYIVARLPLEVEWEKAASWDSRRHKKRLYPWGDTWANERANTLEGRGSWLTTPVGSYPDGVSAYGLHDCVGNVWEWTASVYQSYPGAPRTFYEEGSYVLRGLSCASLSTHARCSYRSRLPKGYWRYHLGFRIVIGAKIEDLAATDR